MDLARPLSTVTPTLDAAVLQALSATTAWTTGGEVHRRAGVGSADGIRRVLGRLVSQGIVLADRHPHATLYLLNREHVCAPAVVAFGRMRLEIIDRIQKALSQWHQQPVHASLFGSFARGEAGAESDIDVLVVRHRGQATVEGERREQEAWDEQVEDLAASVLSWTGNPAHVVSVADLELTRLVSAKDPLVTSWRADHVDLSGVRLLELLRRAS